MVVTLGLCGVAVVQWHREAVFRGHLDELGRRLGEESRLRAEAVAQGEAFGREIERLTALRADTEAKLLEMTARVQSLEARPPVDDAKTAVLEAEAERLRAGAVEAREALAARVATMAEQNAAIERANLQLKAVSAARDEAMAKLNERTRAYNELMAKQAKAGR